MATQDDTHPLVRGLCPRPRFARLAGGSAGALPSTGGTRFAGPPAPAGAGQISLRLWLPVGPFR